MDECRGLRVCRVDLEPIGGAEGGGGPAKGEEEHWQTSLAVRGQVQKQFLC